MLDENDPLMVIAIEWWKIPLFEVKTLINVFKELPPLDKSLSVMKRECMAEYGLFERTCYRF